MTEINEFNQIVGGSLPHWQGAAIPMSLFLQGRYCSIASLDVDKHAAPLFDALTIRNQGES